MRKFKMLAAAVIIFTLLVSAVFLACSRSTPAAGAGGRTYSLTVASHPAAPYYFPVYVAQEKGWFEDAGLTLRELVFTNGPIMVEALGGNAWDVGMTGIGGVLSGTIVHNTAVIAPLSSDDGGQYLFVRNDSPILAAGSGHNLLDPRIYGNAASWRGSRVLVNTGMVMHYLLIKVLGGFNLTTNDVQLVSMDISITASAFRAGEGDVCATNISGGAMTMLNDPDYKPVANGRWADTGLMGVAIANRNSMADPEKLEAIKILFRVYHQAVEWIQGNNSRELIDLAVDFTDEAGVGMDRPTAEFYMTVDPLYTLQEAVDMMTTRAPGRDHTVLEERVIGVLDFFIDTGSRQQGDVEKFLGHVDPSVLQEVVRSR